MKQHIKPFFMTVFLAALGIFMLLFQKYERDSLLSYPILNQSEISALIAGKQPAATPHDLLYYQDQPLLFIQDLNTFFIPVNSSENFTSALRCTGNGDIYFIPNNNESPENPAGSGSYSFHVYVIDDSSYFETTVSFIPTAILTFRTESFEHENAYGHMDFYMPDDQEIGMYSYKSSEAKLSYETVNGLLPQAERNYTLKMTKNGEQNKLNLANLRKDDDWELDSLLGCPDQILEFYKGWNDFCSSAGQEQFMVHYQTIDFYLDEQYMGVYLLRIPLDMKQLTSVEGSFITEETYLMNPFDAYETDTLHDLLESTITDSSLCLEYYFWMDEKNEAAILHAIPRRFTKYTEIDSEEDQ